MNTPKTQPGGSLEPVGSASRWKLMDVVFGDNLQRPRQLIIEVHPPTGNGPWDKWWRYTTCSESGGVGGLSENSLRTRDEWLKWVDRFTEDLTGREIREAKEYALAPFVEPQCWTDFRKRYVETGDPWMRETQNDPDQRPGDTNQKPL